MYKKIFKLSPVEIRFELYGSKNTKVQNAPAFWSRHQHYIEKSYNYSVDKDQYDEIEFELKTVCPKEKIVFEKVKIKLDAKYSVNYFLTKPLGNHHIIFYDTDINKLKDFLNTLKGKY